MSSGSKTAIRANDTGTPAERAQPGWTVLVGQVAAVAVREMMLPAAAAMTAALTVARDCLHPALHPAADATLPQPADTVRPVVLVHGFGAWQSCWFALARALRAQGVAVATVNYSSFGSSVEQLADHLTTTVQRLIDRTGAGKVHLVGHSLGGLIIAQALTDDRFARCVDVVVTIGSPFGGSPWADVLPIGSLVRALRAGSPLLRRLARAPARQEVRWLSFISTVDVIVPVSRATPPCRWAQRVTVTKAGHSGMLLDPQVISRIVAAVTEGLPGSAPGTGEAAEPS